MSSSSTHRTNAVFQPKGKNTKIANLESDSQRNASMIELQAKRNTKQRRLQSFDSESGALLRMQTSMIDIPTGSLSNSLNWDTSPFKVHGSKGENISHEGLQNLAEILDKENENNQFGTFTSTQHSEKDDEINTSKQKVPKRRLSISEKITKSISIIKPKWQQDLEEYPKKRKTQIADCNFELPKFLSEQFTAMGIESIFKNEPLHKKFSISLIDCKINTYIVHREEETVHFIVVTGFEKGNQMEIEKKGAKNSTTTGDDTGPINNFNGDYSQGACTVTIFKIAKGKGQTTPRDIKEVHKQQLTNVNYQYINIKNLKPVCYNNDAIYYVVFDNDLEKNQYTKTLVKYDFTDGPNGNPQNIGSSAGNIDMPVQDGIPMFAATTIFTSSKHKEIKQDDILIEDKFLKQTFAITYFRGKDGDMYLGKKDVAENVENVENVENEEERKTNKWQYSVFSLFAIGEELESQPGTYLDLEKSSTPLWIKNKHDKFYDVSKNLTVDRKNLKDYNKLKKEIEKKYQKAKNQYNKCMNCKPFYFYKNVYDEKLQQMVINKSKIIDQEQRYDLFKNAFEKDLEDDQFQDDEEKSNNNYDNQLQTINIVADNEENNFSVIFIFNDNLVYKRYIDSSHKLLENYNHQAQHPFTKYSKTKFWGKQLSEKFDNLFIQCHLNDVRNIVYLDQNGELYFGKDDNKTIFNNDQYYYVFDTINGNNRFDVPRLENSSDNCDIRFKIIGGTNEGLSLSIRRYIDDQQLISLKMTQEYSFEGYKNACVTWSSSQYTLPEYKNAYVQNIQWCQFNNVRKFARIFEYRLIINKNFLQDIIIQLIGLKIVLFSDKYESWGDKNWFYPIYDNKSIIRGTQWLPSDVKDPKNMGYFRLENLNQNDWDNQTLISKSMSRTFIDFKNHIQGQIILVQTEIGSGISENIQKFTQDEIISILEEQLRITLNQVKYNPEDIIKMNFHAKNYDPFQSLQILGGQCIADFFINDPQVITSFTKLDQLTQKKEHHHHSLLCQYLSNNGDFINESRKFPKDKDKVNLNVRQALQETELIRHPYEITKDFISSNPLKRCFDYEKGNQRDKAKHILTANHLVEFILTKQETSIQEYGIVMGSLYDMLEHKVKIADFFVHESNDEDFEFIEQKQRRTYSQFVNFELLPESSQDKSAIRPLFREHFPILDLVTSEEIINKSINHIQEPEEKNLNIDKDKLKKNFSIFFDSDENFNYYGQSSGKMCKVQTFLIDHSILELEMKIHKVLIMKSDVSFTMNFYQLSELMNLINKQYGYNIEQNPVLQKIISGLFNWTKRYFRFQILLYFTYVIPFILQIVVYDNITQDLTQDRTWKIKDCSNEIIICNNISLSVTCIFFIFEFIQLIQLKANYFKTRFWFVLNDPGKNKDFVWFVLQCWYYSIKVNYPLTPLPLNRYYDVLKLQDQTPEYYQEELNRINQLSLLNFVLCLLIILKFCYFMQVFRSFGTMIDLVIKTLGQVKYFIFFFWFMIVSFSVLVKVIGYDITDVDIETQTEYSISNSIMNYFVHIFLNSVGGIDTPNYDFWQNSDDVREKTGKIYKNNYAMGMVALVWVVWIATVIFLFIILCNFMISYIGQSYEEVLEHQTENKFTQRCELNMEFYTLYDFLNSIFRREKKDIKIFLLTANYEEYLDLHCQTLQSDSSGVVKKLKNEIQNQKYATQKLINSAKEEILMVLKAEIQSLKKQE